MSQVFVLDANKQALNPIHPGRARLLLKQGKVAVYRRYPFTIILASEVEQPTLHPLRIKVDPGSHTTGITLINDQRKGNRDVREFLHDDPARLARILAQMKAPLRDAAAVNTTRWALNARLKLLGLPVECGSGGLTKYNRVIRGLNKTHWLDAANVGRSTPALLIIKDVVPLHISATGHGSRQMCRMDKHGFPRTGPKQRKRVHGFQTGDLARAVVASGPKQGTYVGKVNVRTRGVFNITTGSPTFIIATVRSSREPTAIPISSARRRHLLLPPEGVWVPVLYFYGTTDQSYYI